MTNTTRATRYLDTLKNSEEKRKKFIESLAETCNVTESAVAARIARGTAYKWRKQWATFAKDWDDALKQATDKLRKVAWEMALNKDPDTPAATRAHMIQFLLRAHEPWTYDRKAMQQGMVQVETGAEGQVKVTLARIAPGVLDKLLDDSPLLENGEYTVTPGKFEEEESEEDE